MSNINLPENPPQALEQSDLVNTLLLDAILLLENDFRTSGIELNIAGKIFGDVFDLRELIANEVKKTGGPGSEQFYRLLYRADIPENKLNALLQEEAKLSFENKIAELLIIRALQKAFYRIKFK
ncbi:hypothetical protein BH09BAC5_BH09BAC5_28680 [soil metagenome]